MKETELAARRDAGFDGRWIRIAVLLVILVVSFLLRNAVSNPEAALNRATIRSLDAKQETAAQITAAATGASLVVSMLPGDTGTPIANELGDIASKLIVVLSAIVLEKYLLTIFEFLTFAFLIPLACILGILDILNLFHPKRAARDLAVKLVLLGLVLCVTIPSGEYLSTMIRKTYETSINETIDSANRAVEEYSDDVEKMNSDSSGAEATEDDGILSDLGRKLSGAAESAADAVSGAFTAATDIVEQFRLILDRFARAVALMIVLCCGIPIATLFVMILAVKQIFGLRINLGNAVKSRGGEKTHES